MTLQATVLADLQAVGQILKVDLLQAAGGPIITFLSSIGADPSATNILAQRLVLITGLIATLPKLEAQIVQQLSQWLVTKIQADIATLAAAKSA